MLRVLSTTKRGSGEGFDLTDQVEDLSWSSVDPGGHEQCTFTLSRSWFADNPEVARGNLLQVLDGVDVLWRGEIRDIDRGGGDSERIAVTAYGLGIRLKESTMQEIYIDQDFSRWGPIPLARVKSLGPEWKTDDGTFEIRPGASGSSALVLSYSRINNPNPPRGIIECWYDANGIAIGSIYYDRACFDQGSGGYGNNLGSGVGWWFALFLSPDELATSIDLAVIGGAQGPGSLSATTTSRTYAVAELYFNGAFAGDGNWRGELRSLAVIGNHGLTPSGSGAGGFPVSVLVANAAARAPGVTVRKVEQTAYLCEQAAFHKRTANEDVIAELNKPEEHQRSWGTWGPDSPLDRSTDGYFDYRARGSEQPVWTVFREECDDCDLASNTDQLFDTLHVNFTDDSGVERTITRTREVPDLNEIPREESIDGGKMTEAGAEALGDAVLALSGSFAPARGSVVLSQPVRHRTRGWLPAHYLQADGSPLQILGILPASTLFSLDTTPNRRTVFPVKRVSVNAGDKANPVATAELDQGNPAVSALQARLAQNAEMRGG